MPRQKHTAVPEKYFGWLEYLPESQREEAKQKWLARDEVKGLANLAGEMNEQQRQTAHYKQQAEYGQQLASSLSSYQDILPNLHHYANYIRRYKPEEIGAALGGNPQQQQQVQAAIVGNEQQQQEIVKRMQARDLDWSEGQDELLRLREQHHAMQTAVQKANNYIEREVPQLITRVQDGFQALDNRRRSDNIEKFRFDAKRDAYFQKYPDRDRFALAEALEQNPDLLREDFDRLMTHVYGEDDVAAQIQRARDEERTKVKTEFETQRAEQQKNGSPPGEGFGFNTGDSAIIRRRRATEENNRPRFPRTDAEASEQLRDFFARRGPGQAA
jgi:hypothetical protein